MQPTSTAQQRTEALKAMVLSASGWRTVFAPEERSRASAIDATHRDIVALAVDLFGALVRDRIGEDRKPVIAVGTDTRPTGPAIADTVLRVCLARRVEARYLGVVAAPEIMAYVKTSAEIDAFFYISASHNPIGHNGFKLGLADGSVIDRELALPLIESFRAAIPDDGRVSALVEKIGVLSAAEIEEVIALRPEWKARSERAYRAFVTPARATLNVGFGVVAEFNGSARTVSIDREVLPGLGLRFAAYNDNPGEIVHQILPEGVGLDDAADLLRRHHRFDPSFEVAYVPDNDGDRGNLVFVDGDGEPRILDAQTVFALVVLVELADDHLNRSTDDDRPRVVVANGPTSARIDEIAAFFGARVARAEVGEANVVTLVEHLSQNGAVVPIAGEGSNGGSIKPPATVRDPLATIFSLVKARAFRLDRVWDGARGAPERRVPPRFYELASELPRWTTLATDESAAKMHVGSIPHARLKAAWERILADESGRFLDLLQPRYGRLVPRIENYEGTRTTDGPGNRSGGESGGVKLRFLDADGADRASVWMRGSGTEPVFRVLADCRGNEPELLARLVGLHRELVERAAR